ncbi:hypothetical protein A8A01_08905 [Ewingella americana]|uniref:DUF2635 domain-containing protein n=1 Tax=Rahnella victoriana TaxID=1510570 RepID=UPI000BB18ADC|nr:hypothetical protein A9993_02355 [Rahnella victoriana]PKB90125.1 hypothetical protein A8A01_08905 [Ewingella americana]
MFVKPEAGRTVRDPVKGTFLPVEGAEVAESMFWNRRLRDGDVITIDTSAPASKSPASVKGADATTNTDKSAASTDTGSAS